MSYEVNPRDTSRPTNSDMVKMGAAEIRALKEAFTDQWAPRLINESTYTVTEDDVGHLLVMSSGGVVTIPAELPFGLFGVTGLQATTVQADKSVVLANTLLVPPSLTSTLYEDFAFAVVMRVSQNEWLISGNLMFSPATATVTDDRTSNPVTELAAEVNVLAGEVSQLDSRVSVLEESAP